MQTSIAKWGNSLALRLPRHVVEGAKLKEGVSVEVEVREGTLVVTPVRKKFNLAELLAGVTPKNSHSETDWGEPQGEEAW
jgi:antitoxin MazE